MAVVNRVDGVRPALHRLREVVHGHGGVVECVRHAQEYGGAHGGGAGRPETSSRSRMGGGGAGATAVIHRLASSVVLLRGEVRC
ncbi:hypothetical protein ABZ590_20685 [Streptomyces hirsutus]|uniref:hypothetical protein n=1 Tax=Streptomyces hirsutus TaxID=35620 RepID=UPI0033F27EDF